MTSTGNIEAHMRNPELCVCEFAVHALCGMCLDVIVSNIFLLNDIFKIFKVNSFHFSDYEL